MLRKHVLFCLIIAILIAGQANISAGGTTVYSLRPASFAESTRKPHENWTAVAAIIGSSDHSRPRILNSVVRRGAFFDEDNYIFRFDDAKRIFTEEELRSLSIEILKGNIAASEVIQWGFWNYVRAWADADIVTYRGKGASRLDSENLLNYGSNSLQAIARSFDYSQLDFYRYLTTMLRRARISAIRHSKVRNNWEVAEVRRQNGKHAADEIDLDATPPARINLRNLEELVHSIFSILRFDTYTRAYTSSRDAKKSHKDAESIANAAVNKAGASYGDEYILCKYLFGAADFENHVLFEDIGKDDGGIPIIKLYGENGEADLGSQSRKSMGKAGISLRFIKTSALLTAYFHLIHIEVPKQANAEELRKRLLMTLAKEFASISAQVKTAVQTYNLPVNHALSSALESSVMRPLPLDERKAQAIRGVPRKTQAMLRDIFSGLTSGDYVVAIIAPSSIMDNWTYYQKYVAIWSAILRFLIENESDESEIAAYIQQKAADKYSAEEITSALRTLSVSCFIKEETITGIGKKIYSLEPWVFGRYRPGGGKITFPPELYKFAKVQAAADVSKQPVIMEIIRQFNELARLYGYEIPPDRFYIEGTVGELKSNLNSTGRRLGMLLDATGRIEHAISGAPSVRIFRRTERHYDIDAIEVAKKIVSRLKNWTPLTSRPQYAREESGKPSLVDYGFAWIEAPGNEVKYVAVGIEGMEQRPLPWPDIQPDMTHKVSRSIVFGHLQELVFSVLDTQVSIKPIAGGESYKGLEDMKAFLRHQGLYIQREGQILDMNDAFYLEDAAEKFRPKVAESGKFALTIFQTKSSRGLPSNRYFFTLSVDGAVISHGTFHVRIADTGITRITGETIEEFMFYLDPASSIQGHEALGVILAGIYNLRGRNVSRVMTIPGETYLLPDSIQYENMIKRHVWTFYVNQGLEPFSDMTQPGDKMTTGEAVLIARRQTLADKKSLEAANRILSRGALVLHLPFYRSAGPSSPVRDTGTLIETQI